MVSLMGENIVDAHSVKSENLDSAHDRFCWVLSQIPQGKVCSYGELARLSGLGGPRQASRMLRALPTDSSLPWFRIVSAQGKLADFSGAAIQRQRLEAEGVVFTSSGRIPKPYFL